MYHSRSPFTIMCLSTVEARCFPNLTWTLPNLISFNSRRVACAVCSPEVLRGQREVVIIDQISSSSSSINISPTLYRYCKSILTSLQDETWWRRQTVLGIVGHPRRVNIDEGAIGRYGWRSTRGIGQHDLPESTYHSRPPEPTTSYPVEWFQWVPQRTYLSSQERQGRDERDHRGDPLER